MTPQTHLEAGRLSAIAKILDRADGHLSAAVREWATLPAPVDDRNLTGIQSLLEVSRSASHDVSCAVRHAGSGDLAQAHFHLEAARTAPDKHPALAAALYGPLPAGVRTALQLLRGIRGFFSAEAEDAFVRALTGHAQPQGLAS
ncbi:MULTISPECIES: hypothetical protein [unclassified Streptomyces]|uniref:hypothetical protein n=1 Tax=unclassified Streptomyces TaxID=2593676 RepID=UPI000DBA25DE|nr:MULTISPECIES: hypothetical protein [unclassified Streptomyces]MYT73620.1 hypothetical protein [Streptomyces sp. SID8367]RAJ85157.1 hypothetical protein K377_03638 [Streptomyces sp. PsTaAH-137]